MCDGLLQIGNQILDIFQTAAEPDQIGADAGGIQLLVGHLPVGGRGGVEAAGPGVGHMGFDGTKLQMLHEGFRSLPSALEAEGNDTAGATRHVLLSDFIVFIAFQTTIFDPGNLFVLLQVLGDGLGVGTVLTHPEGQAFQTQVQIESALGGLDGTQVPHELGSAFGDEGTGQTEPLGVGDTVIAVVGGTQAWELVGVFGPVEFAAVHDAATHSDTVTVHVLGGGVGDDVSTPLDGTAVDGRGKGVVDDEGKAVVMGGLGKDLDIQHRQSRVGDGFAEDQLGVGANGGANFLVSSIRADEGSIDAHALHGDGNQIKGAAVDGGGGDNVIAAGADIEHGVEIGSLTGTGEHGGAAALQSRDFGGHHVAGGVLKPGVEVAFRLQVKELAHLLGGGIFEGRALHDGHLPGFTVAGGIARLDAQSFGAQFLIHGNHLKKN